MDMTEAGKAITDFAKVEPLLMTIIGMLVPGAAPIAAAIQPFAPVVLAFAARALTDIAQNNGGDVSAALVELLRHLSKDQPNSPTLSGGLGYPSSEDPSAQGSG